MEYSRIVETTAGGRQYAVGHEGMYKKHVVE